MRSVAAQQMRPGLPLLLLVPLLFAAGTPERSAAAMLPQDIPPPHYRWFPVPGAAALLGLRDSLGSEGFLQVLRINRLDLAHVRAGDSLIVPVPAGEDPAPGPLGGSPFPRGIAVADTLPKLLLVSIRVQAFAAYERGRLVRWGPTSTGRKETPTPIGLYHTNWKAKERASTVNREWRLPWYLNLDNYRGISLHEYELPGVPASHSCVRLLEEDARWLYSWADSWQLAPGGRQVLRPGTPVLIFGRYEYGAPPPWKRLPEDPETASVTPAEIESAFRDYMPAGR